MSHFNLELTGYVGRENFNSQQTVRVLNQYPGKHVDVLIDSQGGQLAHGLSIADAFRTHGDVTAHLRGMCASAATIASMGAKKVTMAPDAFYLVHQVMISFFDWSVHNADTLEKYIEALTKQKEDLKTLDSSVAATYASRCKKPVNELLELMKEGKWLTAQEALEWGFVDEITSYNTQPKALNSITKAQAAVFEAQGLPLPPLMIEPDTEPNSIISFFKSLFKSLSMDTKEQNATSPANVAPETQDPVNANPESKDPENGLQFQFEALKKDHEELKAKYEALAKQPGASTGQTVTSPEPPKAEDDDEFTAMMKTNASAKALFDALP